MNIIEICKLPQDKLKERLFVELQNLGYSPVNEDGYIYAEGTHPVLLMAHMDTVHHDNCTIVCVSEDGKYIMSPQGIGGDDRCGIYMILQIVKDVHCSVIFTEDEEIGCVGARKFCKSSYVPEKLNYIIEFDRKGGNDAVFYDCDNDEFEKFITNSDVGFKSAWGSCSDISHVAPHLKVAAVNLSSGYYSPHTQHEYINLEEVENNIKRAMVLINTDTPRYEYIEKVKIKYDYSSLYGRYYGGDFYGASSSIKNKKDDDKDGQFKIEDYYGGGKAKNSVSDFYDEEPQLGLDLYSSIFHKKLCVPNSKVYLKNFNEPDSKPTESLDEYVINKDGTIYGLDEDTALYYPLQEQYKLVDDKGDLISYREEDSMEMPWAFYENIEKINDYIMNLSIYDMTYCTNLSDDFMMILLDAMYPGEANDETDCETFKPESEISVAICK